MTDASDTTKKRPALKPSVCEECAATFEPTRVRQVYCSRSCKTLRKNRETAQGALIITLAKAWRGGKSKRGDDTAKRAFADLCRELDMMNAKDREAGRVPSLAALKRQYRHEVRRA